jgi:hypothetical protein
VPKNATAHALSSVLALIVCGCATNDPVWTKNGATTYEFDIANRECSAQANAIENPVSGQIQAAYNRCMSGKGWRR